MINLTYLSLDWNQINDISPLVQLVNLKTLYIGWNRITDISPIAALYNLEALGLLDNEISNISPLLNLINLKNLELSNNVIVNIDQLTNLINLESLILSNNQIYDVSPLAELFNMLHLSLSHNQVIDISPILGLENLKTLYLDNNPLSSYSCASIIAQWEGNIYVTHDCPKVQPQVSSTSGQIGSTLDQPGWGFTPGGIAELNFRRPDGSLSPTTTEIIQSDGTYNHSWTVTSDAQIGEYQYWAIDLSTGISSPEVSYWIVAPL